MLLYYNYYNNFCRVFRFQHLSFPPYDEEERHIKYKSLKMATMSYCIYIQSVKGILG